MDPNGDRVQDVRDMMDRQLSHLVRLIDDLLDISRVTQGKIDLRKEKITIQAVLQSALESSRPLIEAAGHHLTLDVPEIPLWVHGDLTRLAQATSNLLNNAAKYTPAGGRIAQTGWGQDRDRQKAREAGFNHHLVKPVDFEVFSGLLNGIHKPVSVYQEP